MKQLTSKTSSLLAMLVTASLTTGISEAKAADDEVAQLTTPQNWVEAGLGFVPDANNRFGQYRGLNEAKVYPLLNFDYTQLNKQDATMSRLTGVNLGLDSRELRYEQGKQGDWRINLDINQIPRQETFGVTTAVTGIGTNNVTVPAVQDTTGPNVTLKTLRTGTGVAYSKIMSEKLDLKVQVRNEEKDGTRIFGRGGFAGGVEFVPEPIATTTQQFETILGYTGKKLQLSSGVYLSAFRNDYNVLTVNGGNAGFGAGSDNIITMSLPPDNQAGQVYVAGGYSHSAKTRSNFKLSYAQATQNDTFPEASTEQPGITSLDGKVDTVQAQYGISSKLSAKTTLLADLRYLDRNDKTPVRKYAPNGATSTFTGLYEPRSITTTDAKVEVNYQLANNLRMIGGIDYQINKRYVPWYGSGAIASVAVRENTDEVTYRMTLRRIMSETINGSLTYSLSNRRGSDYTPLVLYNDTAGSNTLAPLHLADRDRQKLRLTGDWAASEKLSIHLMADNILDSYGHSGRSYGPVSGRATNLSLDVGYAVSDKMNWSLWAARNETDNEQTSNSGGIWTAKLGVIGNAVGVGLRVKPKPKYEIGIDGQYIEDLGTYGIDRVTAEPPTDSKYQVTRLGLFGKYEIKKNMGVRVDYAYELWNIDDYTWANWTYTDGTKVFEQPSKGIQYVGVSLYFKL